MRRARIKAVANLSARRPAVKPAESENTEKPCETGSSSIPAEKVVNSSRLEEAVPLVATENIVPNPDQKVVHGPNHDENHQQVAPEQTITFKAPLQMPRNEHSVSSSIPQSSDKFRRFKIAPRLNASRSVIAKSHITEPAISASEQTCEDEGKSSKPEELTHEPQFTFPIKSRLEAPRDPLDVQMQYPSAPPSPFPYAFGHSRIRTDSLCSMKSNRDVTAANLQPRKNIRTEDQKIQDQKKESRERLSNKDLDKSKLRMFDMIYFNPLGNPMKQRSPSKSSVKLKTSESIIQDLPAAAVSAPPAAIAVPQLRLNANGEMVLDETSLVIESEQQKQNRNALATSNVVYDDDLSGNYGYYKRQQRTKEWPHEETVKFYRCLNTVGTDFSLMLNLFPNRSRRDLKLKFKKEEKNNPQLIDKALLKHNTFDLEELKKDLDNEEEERRKSNDLKSSSEVKEIVKRKILKKQELKAQSGTKVEKVLREGVSELIQVSTQEVKENLNVASSFVPKEADRPKKLKVEDGATSVMAIYSAEPTSKPAKRPRQNKASVPGEGGRQTQPVAKKPRKTNLAGASPLVKVPAISGVVKEEKIHKSESALDRPLIIFTTKDTVPSNEIQREPLFKHENKRDTKSVAGGSTAMFTDTASSMQQQITQTPEPTCEIELQNSNVQPSQVEASCSTLSASEVQESVACSIPNEVVEFQPPQSEFLPPQSEFQSPQTEFQPPHLDSTKAAAIAIQPDAEPKLSAAKKPKAKRGKHKPTLVTRLKLDANGDMILDESANAVEVNTSNVEAEEPIASSTAQIPAEKEPLAQFTVVQNTEELVGVDENLNETADVDNEMTFLNNLDLEKLVLVQATRNGEDVFEIHEINPVTQEISEVPLDLPARYFDLIISVMTSQDEEE